MLNSPFTRENLGRLLVGATVAVESVDVRCVVVTVAGRKYEAEKKFPITWAEEREEREEEAEEEHQSFSPLFLPLSSAKKVDVRLGR